MSEYTLRRRMKRSALFFVPFLVLLLVGACTSGSGRTPVTQDGPLPAGGSTTGSSETPAGDSFTVHLDGAVYGKPAVAGDVVYAATENDTVYAVSASDGHVIWQRHLGTPEPESGLACGDIHPLGITGGPAYDAASGRLYVVAEFDGAHHVLVALDAAQGSEVLRIPVDPPLGDSAAHLQRPALTSAGGRVFAAFGGQFGDCGTYTGSVASVDLGTKAVSWFSASTSGRGGMWAPGAAAGVDGKLFFSVGNGNATSGAWDGTDSVVALTSDAKRADYFAPSSWAADNAGDKDLGSMNPAVVGTHVVIAGKAGIGYVLDAGHLGGIGGQVSTFGVEGDCRAFGPAAVDGEVVYLPCASGTEAVRIGSDGAATVLWHAKVPANGPPTLAAGHVWVTGWNAARLYALDPATGAVRQQISTGALPHFATPAVAGPRIVLGTLDGLAFFH